MSIVDYSRDPFWPQSSDVNYERVRFECYSSYKADERPTAFTYQGRRLEISEIVDQRYEGCIDASRPRIDYFKVNTLEWHIFLLQYLSLFDAWSVCV